MADSPSTPETPNVPGEAIPASPSSQQAQPASQSLDPLDIATRGLDAAMAADTNKISVETPNSGIATHNEINKVITTILDSKKISKNERNFGAILTGISILCQQGATSPKCSQNKNIKIAGIEIKVSDITSACKNSGITTRKLARGIASQVLRVAGHYGIEGNLAKTYKLENPDYEKQDLIWVSDFQTFSEDPAMPSHIREWLLNNYNTRFKASKSSNTN